VLDKVSLTSFGGFTFYLSARADFMQHAPVQGATVAVQPEWNLIEESGVDFVVARDEDLADVALRNRLGIREGRGLALPGGVSIHAIRFSGDGRATGSPNAAVDNGWFRLLPAELASSPERPNLAVGKAVRQSSTADGPATRAVDGNRHGNHADGSVTHPGADPNAWLEVDLGDTMPIGTVQLWGRTDCCQDRLTDYWVLISESPFPDTATVAEMRARHGVHSFPGMKPSPSFSIPTKDVVGRYIRVQLGGTTNSSGDYLSIAELEVFSPADTIVPSETKMPRIVAFDSNDANWLSMTVDAPGQALAQYLLWPNPRATFYVDGSAVTPTRLNGLAAIPIPAGRHTLEMRYCHWPLRLFWLLYATYGLALLASIVPSGISKKLDLLVNTLYRRFSAPGLLSNR
jgi:hypothetical protein